MFAVFMTSESKISVRKEHNRHKKRQKMMVNDVSETFFRCFGHKDIMDPSRSCFKVTLGTS